MVVKLIGVLGADEEEESRICLSRRQMPITIEPDLVMIMALDDYCMACDDDPCDENADEHINNRDCKIFEENYRSLSKNELIASLRVTQADVMSTLAKTVTCVGCRRSVESLFTMAIGKSALEPVVFDEDGTISVDKEHIDVEDSLANLLTCQVSSLSRNLLGEGDTKAKSKTGRGGRCSQHSLKGSKKMVNIDNWHETWNCMEAECREEVVVLPYSLLRETLDRHLKKHRFCTDCAYMVNRAYTILTEENKEPARATGEIPPDTCPRVNPDGSVNMYSGISTCAVDKHVHVQCCPSLINKIFHLVEHELSGLRDERHAKTMVKAQKELLICIGVALLERLEKIQQKIKEGQWTCDLLFLTVLKTLRTSLDTAAEKKRFDADLDLLCQEFEKDDKKKDGKRERKRNQRARKKENKNKALAQTDNCLQGEMNNEQHTKLNLIENKAKKADNKERLHLKQINTEMIHYNGSSTSWISENKWSSESVRPKLLYQPGNGNKFRCLSLKTKYEEDRDVQVPQEEIRMYQGLDGHQAEQLFWAYLRIFD